MTAVTFKTAVKYFQQTCHAQFLWTQLEFAEIERIALQNFTDEHELCQTAKSVKEVLKRLMYFKYFSMRIAKTLQLQAFHF